MIQLTNSKLLAFVCFFLSVGLLVSCKKDEDKRTSQIQLLSFGPTGAKHGDTLRFFGTNLDKVTEVMFTGNGASVKQSEFKTQTWEEIRLVVPEAAEKGFVTLKTPQGDLQSKTQFNLNVTSTVTNISGPTRPGDNLTLTGQYMNWVKSVTFNKDITVTSFVSQTISQLVVKVPDAAQTGRLMISYGGTDSMDVETDTAWIKLPMITGMTPNPVKHADNLTITGTDLDLAKKLMFTGVATPVTSFVSQTATQIVVKVPAGAQKGMITLEAASGVQTTSPADLTLLLPIVTTMTPNPLDPGANLTITGTNFDLVTSVTFENAPAVTSFVSRTATQIVVKSPAGIARGQITLGVLNSTVTVKSADILEITGAAPPPTMSFPIYDDAVTSNWTGNGGWIGGGWGGTSNRDNTSPVRAGTKSVKIDYVGGWGSPLQLGGANISLASYTKFKVSIYGGAGSDGKKINIGLNGGDAYTITLEEGKWVDYSIPFSSMGNPATLKEIWVKEFNGSGGFSVYVDALGLD